MGVSPWHSVRKSPSSPNGATRVDLPGVPAAPFGGSVDRTLMLETAIRMVVIAYWRHACRCFATPKDASYEFLGLASEAVAWHCFAIQSQARQFRLGIEVANLR